MKNKFKGLQIKVKNSAVTLVELLIALGISSVIIVTAFGTVGNVYFIQKRAVVSQEFYAETRLLMEKIVQIVRNNTLDYDRYFLEEGPPTDDCSIFVGEQTPTGDSVVNDENGGDRRGALIYPDIFYWDTNGDGEQDRNLGGVNLDGDDDHCSRAFDQEEQQEFLYVINGSRSMRMKVAKGGGLGKKRRILVETQVGVDEDGDGEADSWTTNPVWNDLTGVCSDGLSVTLGEQTQEFCERAHEMVAISPPSIVVDELKFYPYPDRDPFLAFRVDDSQVHPHVFISVKSSLRDFEAYGFNDEDKPEISFQTSATSRVFGDPR